ncbi:Cof-type HAD-IIB family hydrolase [Bacillus sp. PS06]|uniref:Cof-type HAD-IIB family hydrolase n=1 Tax=Bacillus sp. PS06 TaxID=2764176 RepID=UPI001781982F|nr:Cof-type HAD-IIB family hydrolase [Bacillus sp. PS06]MBD8067735.1 HAD family phosphatase [Bacillus sp. PS06]
MSYQLLAINIDGTLLRPNGRIQTGTKEAIEFVQRKGVYVTLVTNRNFLSAKKVAKALKIDSLLITHSGAFISSTLDHPIVDKRLSEEKTFNLVQILENYECNIRLVHERFSVGNRLRMPRNLISRAVFGSGDSLFYPIQFVTSLGDYLTDNPLAPQKIEVYFGSEGEQEEVSQLLETNFEELSLVKIDKRKLEIVPKGVSKGNGLKKLCNHVGISLDKTVAIGDSLDDMEMIESVGLGVAMWNAPNELKRSADWVTRSNNQHGVSYMIKEHFRKQQRLEFLRKIKIEK